MPSSSIKPRPVAASATFGRHVFVNCPFDNSYLKFLHPLLFTIHDAGFQARIALEDTGASESRLDKITRLVRESKFSIHDMSRVGLSSGPKPVPRFNMPFECGLAFGSMRYGRNQDRDLLVVVSEPFQDKKSISDLAGIDPGYYKGSPEILVAVVRKFLAAKHPSGTTAVIGATAIYKRYELFKQGLPPVAKALGFSVKELTSLSYVAEWLDLATAWMIEHE